MYVAHEVLGKKIILFIDIQKYYVHNPHKFVSLVIESLN